MKNLQWFTLVASVSLLFSSCDFHENNNKRKIDKLGLLKSYVQDSLNQNFSDDDHKYLLISKGGCLGCNKRSFDFFKASERCSKLTIITNSPQLSGMVLLEQKVSKIIVDDDPYRLQRLNLEANFTPSIFYVKNGKLDSLINIPPKSYIKYFKKLSCFNK